MAGRQVISSAMLEKIVFSAKLAFCLLSIPISRIFDRAFRAYQLEDLTSIFRLEQKLLLCRSQCNWQPRPLVMQLLMYEDECYGWSKLACCCAWDSLLAFFVVDGGQIFGVTTVLISAVSLLLLVVRSCDAAVGSWSSHVRCVYCKMYASL